MNPGYLTACLARNAGAISGLRADGGTGIDFRLSEALAAKLGLPLSVLWFENEPSEENDPVLEVFAMLAHGLCDMVPSHPLYQPAIGAPPAETGPLPRWLGMPEVIDAETQRPIAAHLPHVALEPISVTKPYMRAEIGLVYAEHSPEPKDLGDLAGRKVAYQQGTLSGSILLTNVPEIASGAQTFNPGPKFLWNLESGTVDVAIVDVAAYDHHLKHNKISKLKLAEWRHPLGMDIGISVLERQEDLLAALNAGLSELFQSGEIEAMALDEQVTYTTPNFEGPHPPFSLKDLFSARRQ